MVLLQKINTESLSPCGLTTVAVCWLTACAGAQAKTTFIDHVKPILREHCAGCHNQDDAASGLALDAFDASLAGGASGEVISASDPDGSRLWRLINHDEEPVMPPGGDKIPAEQLATVKAWIEGGLLRDDGSKPIASKKPAIQRIDATSSDQPAGEPIMPEGVFREPMLTGPTVGPISSLATSPCAPIVAVPWQRQVSLYHTQTGELLGIIPYLSGAPKVVRFSRDGSLLLVAGGLDGASGSASLYDVKTGAKLVTVGDELDAVLAADLSADNRLVAIGGPKKRVRVYRVADGALAYSCEKHTDWITALSFSPDGTHLASGDRASGLRLWDAAAGHERIELQGHKHAITAVAWRGDSGVLASASEDGFVRLWKPTGASIKSINAHKGGVLTVSIARDGRFVSTGRDKRVRVWKADGGKLADFRRLNDIGLATAFDDQTQRVAVSDWSGTVSLYDIAKKPPLFSLAPNPPTLTQRLAASQASKGLAEKEFASATLSLRAAWSLLAKHAAERTYLEQAKKGAEKAFEEARKALGTSKERLAVAASAMTQSVETFEKAKSKLESAKKRLAEASRQPDGTEDEHETKAGTAGEKAERLADAIEAAKDELVAARKEYKAKKETRQEVANAVTHAEKEKSRAKRRLDEATKAVVRLPATKEQNAECLRLELILKKSEEKLFAASTKHDRLIAEAKLFHQARKQLVAESELASEELDGKVAQQSQLLDERDRVGAIAEAAAAEAAMLRKQLEGLKQRLAEAEADAESKLAELASANKRLDESAADQRMIRRRAMIATARLTDYQEAEAWRAARRGENR